MTRTWLLVQLCYWKGLTGNNRLVFTAESLRKPVAAPSVHEAEKAADLVLASESQQIFRDARIKSD